jgi:hypothetical protein
MMQGLIDDANIDLALKLVGFACLCAVPFWKSQRTNLLLMVILTSGLSGMFA